MPDVAYVTHARDVDPDVEAGPVLAALAKLGLDARAAVWDDAQVDWPAFRLVVVRSTWDYHLRRAAFLAWAGSVAAATRLLNPVEVLARNTDKRYLRQLESSGIPIVPTAWVADPAAAEPAVAGMAGAGRLVVKPAVGAGAHGALMTEHHAVAAAHAGDLAETGTAMVQPYLDVVEGEGEISVVVLSGRPRWALRKTPALTEGGFGDAREQVPLTAALSDFAERVLAAETRLSPATDRSLYARVDVVPDGSGGLLLMELELTEPSLFLTQVPDGPNVFADEIRQRLADGPR